MLCPYCSKTETKVVDKRDAENIASTRRRRECLKCAKRFTTYERIETTQAISQIKKRDGKIVDFDPEKITKVIYKAAQAVGGHDKSESERLSGLVVKFLENKFQGKIPSVEDVQDIVEKILIKEDHAKTAKTYILYRAQHKKLREGKTSFMNVQNTIKSYLDR